jgi:hypothetical protein
LEDAALFGDRVLAVEWPLLLECCAPGASAERIRALLKRGPDWNALLTLAEEHGVLAQLDSQLRAAAPAAAVIPPEVDSLIQKRHREQLMSMLGMTAEMFRLLANLAAAGVEALVVKGPVLSIRAYGDPGVRHYADLDFLLRARDLLAATSVLTECHYESDVPVSAMRAGKIPGEYLFAKPGTRLLVELHTEQTFRYFPRPLPMEDYFARRTHVELDGNRVPALSEEDEFVLICIHGAKHFWERLMWVADVAAMVATCKRLDWEAVHRSARAVGAERMVNVALRLVQDLLRSEIPAAAKERMQRDRGAKRVCERIKSWLPYAGAAPPNLLRRAMFRVNMRGGLIAGPAYLLRLSLSPTEEDWVEGAETKRSWIWDAVQRPLRLLKKYGQDGKS